MLKVFTYFDSKAEVYGKPVLFRSKGEALRMWQDVANDKQTAIGQHPEDYTLFEIAEFDENKGNIIPKKAHESIGCAIDFVRPDRQLQIPGTEEKKS